MGVCMSEMIRAFIAFDISEELVLKRLLHVQNTLTKTGADLRLVKPTNIHITLRFLGNIPAAMINPIHEEMKKVFSTPFEVEIRGIGAFPNLRRIRVVWAGIQRGANELRDISNQLEPKLRKLGFRPDPKGFSPHLTIARVKSGRHRAELVRCIEELIDYQFGIVKAECLRLKRSVLTPRGPIYSTLREVKAVDIER